MKHKTLELTGTKLDAAVGKSLGLTTGIRDRTGLPLFKTYQTEGLLAGEPTENNYFEPSCVWAHGGPIIDRALISLEFDTATRIWTATHPGVPGVIPPKSMHAESPLVAAMVAFVRVRLGDEVDL